MEFDIIPYGDITWGAKLGAGSFGSVYRGQYLGIDIAIKEVLPSKEYDYFEREWRIMRECRHPNIVLFLGLSKAPDNDGRVFIISEYVPRGNLRQYILSSSPFPWRLRLSFATDVTRAVAYLHARQCIHRDLKGENLLVTSNERIKITDFGFARITSRNADEMRRMTFCGTDGYMSPEIINGLSFDLPTDVFSLGIIFIEILSRRLVDSKTYTREAPDFTPDPAEVRRRASPGCPPALIELALACVLTDPAKRPAMPQVLSRLRDIEIDVLSRPETGSEHVGSVRLLKRDGPRAIPSFEPPPVSDKAAAGSQLNGHGIGHAPNKAAEEEEEEDALAALAVPVPIDGGGAVTPTSKGTWRTARWDERSSTMTLAAASQSAVRDAAPLLATADTSDSLDAPSSTSSDLHAARVTTASHFHDAEPGGVGNDTTVSVVTVKGYTRPSSIEHLATDLGTPAPAPEVLAAADSAMRSDSIVTASSHVAAAASVSTAPTSPRSPRTPSGKGQPSVQTIPSLASSEYVSPRRAKQNTHAATHANGYDDFQPLPAEPLPAASRAASAAGALGTHRFTLIAKDPPTPGRKVSSAFATNFSFAFLPKALAGLRDKCPVCTKRVGRAALQCDDCGMLVHVRCSHAAPLNCGHDAV